MIWTRAATSPDFVRNMEVITSSASEQSDLAIYVDSRESASGIPEQLKQHGFFEIREKALSSGDLIIGDMGIERKTWADLIKSLLDGRYFRQLILLKRVYRRRMLIIEGTPVADTQLSSRALQGALLKTSGGMQIPILQTVNTADTVCKILHLAYQVLVAGPGSFHKRPLDADTRGFYQRFILAGVPGIGMMRAQALLEHFGSLRAIFTASAKEIEKVVGIGPIHAQRIFELSTCAASAWGW